MTEILSLSTVVKRDTISIKSKKHPNGKIYEIAAAADFGPLEYALLHQRQQEVAKYERLKRLTKKQQARVEQILDEMIGMVVLELEPAVRRELTVKQKQTLIFAWIMNSRAAEGNGRAAASRSTGKK